VEILVTSLFLFVNKLVRILTEELIVPEKFDEKLLTEELMVKKTVFTEYGFKKMRKLKS
jgi:hypothetical protein